MNYSLVDMRLISKWWIISYQVFIISSSFFAFSCTYTETNGHVGTISKEENQENIVAMMKAHFKTILAYLFSSGMVRDKELPIFIFK